LFVCMCGINLRHCQMLKISTESILERLDILPIDKIFYIRQLHFFIHGPVSAPVPSTLISIGQITGNENGTWAEDQHPRTNWTSHERVWRKAERMDAKHSKFYLCHTS
jgi:hypothetical protein